VEIVQQPLARGADIYPPIGGCRELGIDRVQDFSSFIQANQQGGVPPPFSRILQPLAAGNGAGSLREVFRAQQLTLDWPGAKVVPVGGSGGGLGPAAAG